MDELLREFLTETSEYLDTVDVELVRFERNPNDSAILRNIFRLVHTIKGTCGFLGLPRLEALAHAAETLMGRFRDGEQAVTSRDVTLILATIDRIKHIITELERTSVEPPGRDDDLILPLERSSGGPGRRGIDPAILAAFDEPEAQPPGEERPAPSPQGAAAAEGADAAAGTRQQTIRVAVNTLEHLMTMVSELVLTRNQLLDIARRQEDNTFNVPLQRLSHVTAELQESVMKTRMQPIGSAWQKLPRLVRDLSSELGKPIDLVMRGADTELDRQVLEVIKDPLTHMVRNAADHGLESLAERRALGKPERGTIRLGAYHEGGTITIEIADDGRGLDLAAIRAKAIARGLAPAAEVERMSEAQVAKFIFHPGFSTAEAVTAVSGRGVGMDVVKTNIELIGGVIDIHSEPGRGTVFTVKIPLTLAIIAALIVSVGDQRFAIPQMAVLELVRVRPGSEQRIETVNGAPVLRLRERLLPVMSLARLLGRAGAKEDDDGFIVVIQVGRQRFGLLVDAVFHTEEIVVKPMSRKLRHLQVFSGNTILGDGAVVLIIDPNGVSRILGAQGVDAAAFADALAEMEEEREEEIEATALLVFRAGGPGQKAVQLSLVTRLEEIDATRIEWIGDRPFVQYRGRLMPLVTAHERLVIRKEGMQPILVFSDAERAMGLIVDEIVDIVDERLTIDPVPQRPDLVGSAVVRGQATELINVAYFLPLAHEDWLRRAAVPNAPVRTVLLVDDSDFFRGMLAPVLRAAGYRLALAGSVDEALDVLASQRIIDVVVSDIEMPGKTGFDLIESMRIDQRTRHLPVIALSSYISPAIVERARRYSGVEFVAKFDRGGLLAALAASIDGYGAAA
ncbi:two-component system chemotaxis sensor kinase CheA [Chelatococcus caeni]|uniref:Chemotaxis protein CheA n=1 Tax=Chelatococcus caeni TaxID=1348468 RepID=A0A840C026_9HYPH|nr:hybrid sensor histidine kinase/response regulator [Chelatococcus caeni]MBB4017312.1 two-component system chemotaxis sensor kinase CheA [Chelatococcus caeni]